MEYIKTDLRQRKHLVKLIQLFGNLQASQKKDKLFAFYGLASGQLPVPNYNDSTESVYTNLARWILQDTKDLLLLAMELPSDPDLQELPSWVPSMAPPSLEPNYFRRRLLYLRVYNCARGLSPLIQFEGFDVLCLQGLLVDEVIDVARQNFTAEDDASHAALLRKWQEFAAISSMGEQFFDEVFGETTIAGCSQICSGASRVFSSATRSDICLCKEMVARLTRDHNDDDPRFFSIMQAHLSACVNRVLFHTKAGRLGLGPTSVRKRDEVRIFGGGSAPFLVRRTIGKAEYTTYSLIGHAYINGIMYGEAVSPEATLSICRLI